MTGFDPSFIAEVKARSPIAGLVASQVKLKKAGRALVGLCPFHGEKSPSFYVYPDDGGFHCFGCGARGDAIEWMQRRLSSGSFVDAVRELAITAGMQEPDGVRRPREKWAPAGPDPALAAAEREAEKQDGVERSREFWRDGLAAPGTVVETYLRGRGITAPVPPSIRFAPKMVYWDGPDGPPASRHPAMLCAFVAENAGARQITGLHRTFLRADGSGKADVPKPKKMLGVAWGSALRLASIEGQSVLAISEGIETGLSVLSVRPDLPVWAAGSLGNIAGAGLQLEGAKRRPHPTRPGRYLESEEPDPARPGLRIPPQIRTVIILADADGDAATGAVLIERAQRRWAHQGRRVVPIWPPAGADFNDLLRA